jgi:hypothetical protein
MGGACGQNKQREHEGETYIFRAMAAICNFIYTQWLTRVLAAGRQQVHESTTNPVTPI